MDSYRKGVKSFVRLINAIRDATSPDTGNIQYLAAEALIRGAMARPRDVQEKLGFDRTMVMFMVSVLETGMPSDDVLEELAVEWDREVAEG